jgi:acetyl esterase/lipase
MRIELRNHLEKPACGGCESDFQPYIDTFLLDSTRIPLGGVLVLPGGGYSHRANHEGNPVAERFNALGFHAFVLQYRVSPYHYPAPQRDVIRAVKLIRANAQKWHLDKLAVLGFSAGSHLAASGTLMADEINADEGDEADNFSGKADTLILSYPVISLTDDFAHKGSGLMLFGENSSEAERCKLNLQNLVKPGTPPSFLWHTAEDTGVSVRNSIEFANKMWQNGNCCELHVFPHGNHGLGLGQGRQDLSQWPELAATFLVSSAGFNKA